MLTGFHRANGWSHVGSGASGTKAFETNVIGNRTVNDTCCATSTVGTDVPSQIPIHDIAKAKSRSSATPSTKATIPLWFVQPTSEPGHHQDDEDAGVVDDVGDGAARQHRRPGHRERAEAIDDALVDVVAHADRAVAAAKTIVWTKIPGIRYSR